MNINFWRDSQSNIGNSDGSPITAGLVSSMESVGEHTNQEKHNAYNAVVRWIVGVGVFLLPLFFLPWTSNILEINKQLLLMIVAGGGLIVWLLGIVVSGQVVVRSHVLHGGLFALLGATIVTTIASVASYKSLFGSNASLSESLVSIICLSIIYFLAVSVFDDKGKVLLKVTAGSVLAALVFGLLQMFTVYLVNFPFAISRAFNSIGQLNALGILAAISIALFSRVSLSTKKIPYLDLSKLGILVAVVILAILNWWPLWVVAIAGLVANIALESLAVRNLSQVSETGSRRTSMAKFVMPMTIIVLAVFLMIVKFNFSPVKNQLPVEVSPSFGLSLSLVKSVFGERLIAGYGPENFSLVFDKYGASKLANSTFSNLKFFDATSQVLNFLVHGGVVAALAILYLLWTIGESVFRSIRRKLWTGEAVSELKHYQAVIGTLTALLVAFFLYPFNLTLMLLLYVVLAVTVLVTEEKPKKVFDIEERPMVSLASSLGFITGLILVLTGLYFGGLRYVADYSYAKSLNETNLDKAVAQMVKSTAWNSHDERYFEVSSQAALGLLSRELNTKPAAGDTQQTARVQNYIASAIDLAKKATVAQPEETNAWLNLGSTYQSLLGLVDGVDKLGEEAYVKASSLRPGDPSFQNHVGSMYLAESDLDRQLARNAGPATANGQKYIENATVALTKAEDYFKQAISISDNYGLAIYNLGAVYDRQGKVADSIKQIEKIIPFNANKPNLLFELGLLYYRAGRKDDALAALQRAVVISPTFANARWYLGLIYEERNDFASAINQIEKVLENNKENDLVIKKLEQLRAGQVANPPVKVTDQKPLESTTSGQ